MGRPPRRVGIHGISRPENSGPLRVMVSEAALRPRRRADLDDLSAALTAVYGTDFGVHSPTSISRFTDAARQAASYRVGRVLLAGDAAHVHPPVGGQGFRSACRMRSNLGWKLAQVVKGTSPPTFSIRIRPSAIRSRRWCCATPWRRWRCCARTTASTRCAIASRTSESGRTPQAFGAMMSGLDIRYDLGEGHPLLGRRMPDLELATTDGPRRVFTLLHRRGQSCSIR